MKKGWTPKLTRNIFPAKKNHLNFNLDSGSGKEKNIKVLYCQKEYSLPENFYFQTLNNLKRQSLLSAQKLFNLFFI